MSLDLFGEVGDRPAPSGTDLFGSPSAPVSSKPAGASVSPKETGTSDIFGSLTDTAPARASRKASEALPVRTDAELVELLKQGTTESVKPVDMALTDEQEEIRDAFLRGEDMVISAGAGTGKTSTLVALSEALYESDHLTSGVYITFNKSMADEVGDKFTYANIKGMTTHSLAYRGSMRIPHIAALMPRLNTKARPPRLDQTASTYRVKPLDIFGDEVGDRHHANIVVIKETLKATSLVVMAMDAIDKFCQSSDSAIGTKHVTTDRSLNAYGEGVVDDIRKRVATLASVIWINDICSPAGVLRFKHDYYLKLFCLTEPDIASWFRGGSRKPVLFFDEAQDGRPVLTKLIMDQRPRMQVVMCGDSSQAIYGFLGCVDALRIFKGYDDVHAYTLTQTFRFGAAFARLANNVLSVIPGSDVRLVPSIDIESEIALYTPHDHSGFDAVLCRTNTEVIEAVCELYEAGKLVYTTADTERTLRISRDLLRIRTGERPLSSEMKFIRNSEHLNEMILKHRSDGRFEDSDLTDIPASAAGGGDTPFDDIVGLIDWISKNGVEKIIEVLENGIVNSEDDADVMVSTVHKSKGRQWDSVLIKNIEKMIPNHNVVDRDSGSYGWAMLLYVALTRARTTMYMTIDGPPPSWLDARGGSTSPSQTSKAWTYLHSFGIEPTSALIESMEKNSISPSKIAQTIVAVSEMFMQNTSNSTRSMNIASVFREVELASLIEVTELAREHDLPPGLCVEMMSPVNADKWETSGIRAMLSNPTAGMAGLV